MINILNLIIYYLKCAFNILYSYINRSNDIEEKTNKNVKKKIKINDYLYIVKLYGTYYEMGKQYGKLMKSILLKDINKGKIYINDNQYFISKKIPEKYKKETIFETIIYYYNENLEYFNKDVLDFIKGVSENGNINYNDLIIVNFLSDLMDNHCILLSKKINNKRLNIRTLDYGSPLLTHSLIVFFPKDKIPYISLNASFIIGVVTGYSNNGIFFGESYYDSIIGDQSYDGMPFSHIAHKILSESKDINDAKEILKNCDRKSNLQLLISDNNNSKIFFSCKDKLIENQSGDYVYSVTPNEKDKFNENINYLDSIDNIVKYFIPKTKSGELHIMMIYDGCVYISVTTKLFQSYNNKFYKFYSSDLFKSSKYE